VQDDVAEAYEQYLGQPSGTGMPTSRLERWVWRFNVRLRVARKLRKEHERAPARAPAPSPKLERAPVTLHSRALVRLLPGVPPLMGAHVAPLVGTVVAEGALVRLVTRVDSFVH
jgi:hypothetical protein